MTDFLEKVKDYLPVPLILNSIEQYLINSEELTYDLESCYLNLKGDVHFNYKEEFKIHQKECLNNLFNFFSLYNIISNVIEKFFIENCPLVFSDSCTNVLKEFNEINSKIKLDLQTFVEFLIESDAEMKSLEINLTSIKTSSIKRIVMNSILTLNKENFYSQINDVLE